MKTFARIFFYFLGGIFSFTAIVVVIASIWYHQSESDEFYNRIDAYYALEEQRDSLRAVIDSLVLVDAQDELARIEQSEEYQQLIATPKPPTGFSMAIIVTVFIIVIALQFAGLAVLCFFLAKKFQNNNRPQDNKIKLTNMKKHCLILFLAFAAPLMAQVSGLSTNKSAYIESYQDDGEVYTVVEQKPEFPGGQDALFQYIKQNLYYPPTVKADGIQGRAICTFVINTDGSICCAEVVKSTGNALLDREAVLLIKNMPAWTPGTQNGKPVRVKYMIPIVFKIQ